MPTPRPLAAPSAPGLVVLLGAPGSGRTTLLTRLSEAASGPALVGGGLASLRGVPGLALSRAVRARLPENDVDLAVEAVRARVRGGLLVLDDLQWADSLTLAVVPRLAPHVRVLAAVRTPSDLPGEVLAALRAAATGWHVVPRLNAAAAGELARATAPGLATPVVDLVVERAGGIPLAVKVLAQRAAKASVAPGAVTDRSQVFDAATLAAAKAQANRATNELDRAIAETVAQLSMPGRTSVAALGLLGRPASDDLLGPGVDELIEAGLAIRSGETVSPAAPYVAEVAAGVLPAADRQALHRRLAKLCPDGEAARHFAAAGDGVDALRCALSAADKARTSGERAAHLLLAAGLRTTEVPIRTRLDAVAAALAVGRHHVALRTLDELDSDLPPAPDADRTEWLVRRSEALLHAGEAAQSLQVALSGVQAMDSQTPIRMHAELARTRLLAAVGASAHEEIATALTDATETLAAIERAGGESADAAAVRFGLAIGGASQRVAGWADALSSAADAARAAGRYSDEQWCRWTLAESLAADGDISAAATAAADGVGRCAIDGAYSWEARFIGLRLWIDALRGEDLDDVARRAADLLDRSVPGRARAYALAASCLAAADTGALGLARSQLDTHHQPALRGLRGLPAEALSWVSAEVAWLDGSSAQTPAPDPADGVDSVDRTSAADSALLAGLNAITNNWAQFERNDSDRADSGSPASGQVGSAATSAKAAGPIRAAGPITPVAPPAVASTLAAWSRAAGGWPSAPAFEQAAQAWAELATREHIRALLGVLIAPDPPDAAVPLLLKAEDTANDAGLVVLLGRIRRGLRQYAAHGRVANRDLSERPKRLDVDGTPLSGRETEILQLVAAGEPTRRIAARLGLSRDTVETHVRSGMRKLGARTRTEAAARVMAELTAARS